MKRLFNLRRVLQVFEMEKIVDMSISKIGLEDGDNKGIFSSRNSFPGIFELQSNKRNGLHDVQFRTR